MSKILEMKLDNKQLVKRIQESLRHTTCQKITNGIYSFTYQNEVNKAMGKSFKVSMNDENVRIETLRKYRNEMFTR